MPELDVAVHSSISDIAADDWDRLAGDDFPFLRHAFLAAAEETGCVSDTTGWQPRHLALSDDGRLRAAMPLYEKTHSWGEFVFDWAWADAYRRAGLAYYPKLVSAIPFTPAPSKRDHRKPRSENQPSVNGPGIPAHSEGRAQRPRQRSCQERKHV